MKNKYATIGIILSTIVLAGIAIFTAIKLYQSREVAIAPNAPSSKPKAAPVTLLGTPVPGNCSLSFSLVPEGNVFCKSKLVYKDVSTNTAGNYSLNSSNLIGANETVTVGQKLVFVIYPGPASVSKQFTVTDKLSSEVTFLDSDSTCSYNTSSRVITCSNDSTEIQFAYRVTVNSTATGIITNNASVIDTAGEEPSICSVSVTVRSSTTTPTATATSTSTATATATSTSTASTTPTATATATSNPACNNSCTSNSNCPSGLMCYIANGSTSGNCRNTQCLSESDCTCSVVTSTPTNTSEPTLPVVGTRWPTILGTGFGILVILGSLLLAL